MKLEYRMHTIVLDYLYRARTYINNQEHIKDLVTLCQLTIQPSLSNLDQTNIYASSG